MTVSRRLRFEILRRDGHACHYCGQMAPHVKLTVDHIVPVALGGSDDPSNLTAACEDCNGGKTSTSPDESTVADIDYRAERWADAMRRAAEIQDADRDALERELLVWDKAWLRWRCADDENNKVPRPETWRHSLKNLLAAGLTMDELLEFVPVAMESKADAQNTFRYFCGCGWTRVRQRQQIARDLLDQEEHWPELSDRRLDPDEPVALREVMASWFDNLGEMLGV